MAVSDKHENGSTRSSCGKAAFGLNGVTELGCMDKVIRRERRRAV